MQEAWCDVLLHQRPHVTDLLNELCSRHGDQHQCEVAVCTAAPCKGYAEAILAELDPSRQHLRAREAEFVTGTRDKNLSMVTTMPCTTVIMDDCPDHKSGQTVWPTADLRHGLHVPDYVPFVDQDFILVSLRKLKEVVTTVSCSHPLMICTLNFSVFSLPLPTCTNTCSMHLYCSSFKQLQSLEMTSRSGAAFCPLPEPTSQS